MWCAQSVPLGAVGCFSGGEGEHAHGRCIGSHFGSCVGLRARCCGGHRFSVPENLLCRKIPRVGALLFVHFVPSRAEIVKGTRDGLENVIGGRKSVVCAAAAAAAAGQ